MDKSRKFTLAPQERLAQVEDLAPRFFREILDMDYFECLVTDESDLRDFTNAFANDHSTEVAMMLDRLEAHYLIDARVVDSTRVVDLLEFLQSQGVSG
jgi:hypothetical protein